MASWRRKVIALFPQMRQDVQQPDYSIYWVFTDLVLCIREAHQQNDTKTLRRIYGFAEWCLEQRAEELWNPAGVSFYEHLFFSQRSIWPEIIPWLSPQVIEECWELWEQFLPVEDWVEVRRLIATCRTPRYLEARLNKRPSPKRRIHEVPKSVIGEECI